MTKPEWHIRSGQPADRSLLSTFACVDLSVHWQVEVEQFIRTQLVDWAFDPHATSGDPRLLLAFVTATEELFGMAAHERVVIESPTAQFDAPPYPTSPDGAAAAASARVSPGRGMGRIPTDSTRQGDT
ncbi:MAG TPA: hypothetical protein VFZ32_05060 [Micromonosporaceae bacterium]